MTMLPRAPVLLSAPAAALSRNGIAHQQKPEPVTAEISSRWTSSSAPRCHAQLVIATSFCLSISALNEPFVRMKILKADRASRGHLRDCEIFNEPSFEALISAQFVCCVVLSSWPVSGCCGVPAAANCWKLETCCGAELRPLATETTGHWPD